MKIAFVGKGGSGKTSHAAIFSRWESLNHPVVVIDADINTHMADLLSVKVQKDMSWSFGTNTLDIKSILRGENTRITNLQSMRKTTPPARGSFLPNWNDCFEGALRPFFSKVHKNLLLGIVGSYEGEHIGASCYHNDLAVGENFLSHFYDESATLVVDMVAGTDAFASSLYAQFDALVLQVEPTLRGIAVYEQYVALARQAGVLGHLVVVGNKVSTPEQRTFLEQKIAPEHFCCALPLWDWMQEYDMGGRMPDGEDLVLAYEDFGRKVRQAILAKRWSKKNHLEKLYAVHRTYVSQDFVMRAHGDLCQQIDPDFQFPIRDRS